MWRQGHAGESYPPHLPCKNAAYPYSMAENLLLRGGRNEVSGIVGFTKMTSMRQGDKAEEYLFLVSLVSINLASVQPAACAWLDGSRLLR